MIFSLPLASDVREVVQIYKMTYVCTYLFLFSLSPHHVFSLRESRESFDNTSIVLLKKLVTSSEFILFITRIDRLFSFYILTLAFRLKLRTQSHFTYIRYSKTEGQPRLTRLSTIPVLCPNRFSHALVTLSFLAFHVFIS